MHKKNFFGILGIISFGAIFFTPINSNIWISFLILGFIFGYLWLKN